MKPRRNLCEETKTKKELSPGIKQADVNHSTVTAQSQHTVTAQSQLTPGIKQADVTAQSQHSQSTVTA